MLLGRIITNDSALLIEARSFVTVTLKIKVCIQEPDKKTPTILPYSLLTNSDGSVAIHNPPPRLPEGEILSIHASVENTTLVQRGDCFINISLMPGTGLLSTAVSVYETLVQGYVSNDVYLSYPVTLEHSFVGGNVKPITVTAPGAGNEISYTVPSYTRMRLHSMLFTLTTNAGAGVRYVSVKLYDSIATREVLRIYAFDTQDPSLVKYYSWSRFIQSRVTTGALLVVATEFPDLFLRAGMQIITVTDNINAGDSFGSITIYGETEFESLLTTGASGGGGGKGAS